MRLFYDKAYSTFEDEIVRKIINELSNCDVRTVNHDELMNRVLKMHFNYAVPVLDEKATSMLVLEDDDGRRYKQDINANYSNHNVYATGIYKIQYTGSTELFKIMPSIHTEIGESIALQNSTIEFKIRTSFVRLELTDAWKRTLKEDALTVRNNILNNLNQLTLDLNNSRLKIKEKIKVYLSEKIKGAEEQIKRNNDINPFL